MVSMNGTARGFRARLTMLAVSTALASTIAGHAQAQVGAFSNRDENGVDIVNGSFVMPFEEGSIGSGASKLSLNRLRGANVDTLEWEATSFVRTVSGTTTVTIISLPDGSTDRFVGTQTVSGKQDGATLTKSGPSDYLYMTADGTTIRFIDPSGGVLSGKTSSFCNDDPVNASSQQCILLPYEIVPRAGSKTTLSWGTLQSPVYDSSQEDGYSGFIFAHRLEQIANAAQYAIALVYDPSVWARRIRADFRNDAIGSTVLGTVHYAYPAFDQVNVTDMAGAVWEIRNNSIKRPTEATPGLVVTSASATTLTVARDGITTNYSWSTAGGNITTVRTNAVGLPTTFVTATAVRRPHSVTNEDGKTVTTTYDTAGRPTRVTMSEGNYVQTTYDARGNVTETRAVAKPGSGLADIVTTAAYPTICTNVAICDQPITTTDALGRVTDYSYDGTTGLVTAVTAPPATSGAVRGETRFTYSTVAGMPRLSAVSACRTTASCIGTSDELRTTLSFDANGNTTGVARGPGNGSLTQSVAITYTSLGDVASVDGPLPGSDDVVTFAYDAARRRTRAVGPDPDGAGPRQRAATRTTYAADGIVSEVAAGTATDAAGTTFTAAYGETLSYDANRRVQRRTLVSGGAAYGVEDYLYDGLGRVSCTITRMDPASWGPQATTCAPTQTTGPAGPDRVVRRNFTPVGQLRKVTSGQGSAEETADITRTFTPNGQRATDRDGENNLTSYQYDGFDRLVRTSLPPTAQGADASSAGDYEALTYDAAGNVASRRLRDGTTIAFAYDALDRVVTRTPPGGEAATTYAYNLLGQLTAEQRGPFAALMTYDPLGRVAWEAQPLGTIYYAYDIADRRTRTTWPDGYYVDYDYDVAGNVTAIRENGATGGVGVLATYSYDDLGRRSAMTRGNGTTTTYAFDPVSRLSGLSQDLGGASADLTQAFTYNPASQIASVTRSNDGYAWGGAVNVDRAYGVNGLNQLTTSGAVALGYDARGNLTSSGSTTYGYTAENMLKTVSSGETLTYGPFDRLTLYGTAAGTTGFLYDGDRMAAEYDGSNGTLKARYVHGPGEEAPIVAYERVGGTLERRWLHTDERGSVIARSDDAGGQVGINAYDEFGIPAANNGGRFQYTGQAFLPEVGLYHYKARMYSPTLGRFMQTDPIGYGDGMNWYDYVGGDPVNRVDPTGMQAQCGDDGRGCSTIPVIGRRGQASSGVTGNGRDARCGGAFTDNDTQVDCQASLEWPGSTVATAGPQSNCLITNGLPSTCKPAKPSGPDPKKTAARNRLVCNLLAQGGWSFDNAHQRALHLRNPDSGPKQWNNDTYRNAENFLYAALTGYSDVEIWTYQNLIKPIKRVFAGSSAYSVDALQAGYDGNDFHSATKGQMRGWCRNVG